MPITEIKLTFTLIHDTQNFAYMQDIAPDIITASPIFLLKSGIILRMVLINLPFKRFVDILNPIGIGE